jgi:two-component system, cell cycle sensor histidine kinase and response regulator CckA
MIPVDKRQYIDQKILGLMFEWGDLVLAAGAAVTLLLGALDYFVTPENFKQFFLYRLACASVLTLLIVVNKINKKNQNRGLQLALFTVATLTVGAMIELMILSFGGHQSIYYTGMILLYIFCLGFVPLNSLRLSLTYASLAYGIYLVPLLLFDTITNTRVFLNSNIFLIASALSAVIWRYYNDKLLIKNFSLEYELSKEKERLEDVVQEQTKDLKVSEHKLRSLFENATDGILITDENGLILEVNQEAASIYGFAKDALIGTNLELLETDINKTLFRERMKRLLKGEPLLFETKHYRKDGSKVSLEMGAKAVQIADTILVQFFIRDMTEKHMLQEQLVHSQKMESIGSLIGGIAHNFNNFLTAILGNVELITGYGTLDEITAKRMKSIESAARKAASMLSTLLNFSRKEKFEMFPLKLNDVIHEATKFLEGVIDKRIGIKLDLADIPSIEGDQNRLEQVILNIIMNARDAMPDGGLLTIKTHEIRIEKDRFDMPTYIHPGSYILLTISDTGSGMLPEMVNRIFEPFFTTKERGQGTGLGLSLAYRTIKDHKGYITAQSEIGKGSTFSIYLPVVGKDFDRSVQREILFSPATQNILVIDDEEDVLELVRDILETHGYRVLHTLNPLSALNIAKTLMNDLHLVITDIMMPLMNGKELVENLKAIKPDIRIIAISAYSDDTFDKNSVPVDAFLPKPFEAAELLSSVKKVLGAKVKNFLPADPDVSV